MATIIKNWKLNLLGLLCICLLASLGFWQLSRAKHKKILLKSFTERTLHAPLSSTDLNTPNDWRFYRATLKGTFNNQQTFLLDNKTFNNKVGYEVYTVFHANGMSAPILIDRGFVAMGFDRHTLPTIKPVSGKVTVNGMLNLSPAYVALGQMTETPDVSWPLRVEYINLPMLGKIINSSLFPYILTLEPTSPYALDATAITWQIFTVSPERHMGYAVQWFALALTLLVICAVLNRK